MKIILVVRFFVRNNRSHNTMSPNSIADPPCREKPCNTAISVLNPAEAQRTGLITQMKHSNEMIRVVHIITKLELGGAQRNTLDTMHKLQADGYEPILMHGEGGELEAEAEQAKWSNIIIKHLFRNVSIREDYLAFREILRNLRELEPAIVHTHSSKAGILGRIAAHVASVPIVIHTYHGFGFNNRQPRIKQWFYKTLEQICARMCKYLIFVSRENQIEAKKKHIGTHIRSKVIRSGIYMGPERRTINKKKIYADLAIPENAWVVASTGNFKPQKNPMDFVKVAAMVLEHIPDVHFVFMGDGEFRAEVEGWCVANHIDSNVHFPGWCTRPKKGSNLRSHSVSDILSISDCFLLTSLWEGLPRSLVEAFVAGIPAVVNEVDGVRDILQEGRNGFGITPGDIQTAADKIILLAKNPSLARAMGDTARKSIPKEFDVTTMVNEISNLYKLLYDERRLPKAAKGFSRQKVNLHSHGKAQTAHIR